MRKHDVLIAALEQLKEYSDNELIITKDGREYNIDDELKAAKYDSEYTIESGWSVDDVLYQAEEDEVELTEEEAKEILHWIDRKHDATIGINWDVISSYIWDFDYDRKKEKQS